LGEAHFLVDEVPHGQVPDGRADSVLDHQHPLGERWFRNYNSKPVSWVWSGHLVSLVHPPKEC
jgi:hypothetical protein